MKRPRSVSSKKINILTVRQRVRGEIVLLPWRAWVSFTFYTSDIFKSLFKPISYTVILRFLFVICVEIILIILRKETLEDTR